MHFLNPALSDLIKIQNTLFHLLKWLNFFLNVFICIFGSLNLITSSTNLPIWYVCTYRRAVDPTKAILQKAQLILNKVNRITKSRSRLGICQVVVSSSSIINCRPCTIFADRLFWYLMIPLCLVAYCTGACATEHHPHRCL